MSKKGRGLNITVDDLLSSKRLEFAVELFKQGKPMAMKAILIELGKECLDVAKHCTARKCIRYKNHQTSDIKGVVRDMDSDDFDTFNIFWGLSKPEMALYVAQVNGRKEEEAELLEKVIQHFS